MFIDEMSNLGYYYDPDACNQEGPIKWIIGLFRRKKP